MRLGKGPNRILASLFSALFILYRWLISPIIHTLAGPSSGCRFEPTCSEYSQQALNQLGLWRGLWLTVRRISRCHPFGGSGYDPIPVISANSNKRNLRRSVEFKTVALCPTEYSAWPRRVLKRTKKA